MAYVTNVRIRGYSDSSSQSNISAERVGLRDYHSRDFISLHDIDISTPECSPPPQGTLLSDHTRRHSVSGLTFSENVNPEQRRRRSFIEAIYHSDELPPISPQTQNLPAPYYDPDTDTSDSDEDISVHEPHLPFMPDINILTEASASSSASSPDGARPTGTENDWLIAYYLQQEEDRRGRSPDVPPGEPPSLPVVPPTPDDPSLPATPQSTPTSEQEEILRNLLSDMQGVLALYNNNEFPFAVADAPYYKVPPLGNSELRRLNTYKFQGDKEGKGDCGICFSTFVKNERVRILPCKHQYHTKCIDQWFKESGTCPFCRLDVRKELKKRRKHKNRSSASRPGTSAADQSRTRVSTTRQGRSGVRNEEHSRCTIL